MNLMTVVNVLSGLMMAVAGVLFYLYGRNFFFHGPDMSWYIISAGMVLTGISEVLVGFLTLESYYSVLTHLISSITVLAGFSTGLIRAKEGEI